MAAMEAAIAANHPIEIDIQLLADGHIAVFHDKDLERLTGQPGSIADQTLETLPKFHLFGTDQTIPSLTEALDLINGQVPVLVELKKRRQGRPLRVGPAPNPPKIIGENSPFKPLIPSRFAVV